MLRKTPFVIVFVLLISLISGCGKGDERTLSLFQLEFSDEAVAELEVAYKNRLIEDSSYDIPDDTVQKYWKGVKPKGLVGGGYLYYGTFGDCVVWVAQGQTEAIVDFGEIFCLAACKNAVSLISDTLSIATPSRESVLLH